MKKVGVSMDWFKSSRGKKTEDYEKDYLARYKNGEKSKPKRKRVKNQNQRRRHQNRRKQQKKNLMK